MESICYLAIFFFIYLFLNHLMVNKEYFTCDVNMNTYEKCFERHQIRNKGKMRTAEKNFSKLQPMYDKLQKLIIANRQSNHKTSNQLKKIEQIAKGGAAEPDPELCKKHPEAC